MEKSVEGVSEEKHAIGASEIKRVNGVSDIKHANGASEIKRVNGVSDIKRVTDASEIKRVNGVSDIKHANATPEIKRARAAKESQSDQDAVEKTVNKNTDIFSSVQEGMHLPEADPVNYSPSALAYLGDAVYELLIRSLCVCMRNTSVDKLHHLSANLARASSQASMMRFLKDRISKEELAVYKRGRNAKFNTKAKNATYADYREATGFESLIGYLYLSRRSKRATELVREALEYLYGGKINALI